MEAAGCAGAAVGDLFEDLPDDLLVSILADVAASARSPADLAGAIMTCKRFRELGQNKVVLAKVSPRCLAVRAKSWSDSAHRFLQRCADAGNLDACYLLGMIRFYCLGSRGSGAALMAAAAVGGHREALYSLAVIQFNGSGGSKADRDLRAGAALSFLFFVLGLFSDPSLYMVAAVKKWQGEELKRDKGSKLAWRFHFEVQYAPARRFLRASAARD
uniref:At2g35280-like TPR domain-containing protein n=1 Tax=Aegilops tauschii TaxID=37682 RepID=M8CNN6_AEGTA